MLRAWYRWRARHGKEDPTRLGERFGIASASKPAGKVIWAHAVSVGECRAMEPLLAMLRQHKGEYHIVVTTGTRTAAQIVSQRYSVEVIHQYLPAPLPRYIRQFLAHWQPEVALFCESDLWPTILHTLARAKVPTVVFNARMSEKSARRWRWFPALARSLGACIHRCLVQTPQYAERFAVFGCRDIRVTGNIKFDAKPLTCDEHELHRLRDCLGDRPVWIAASTRPGEEEHIIAAHRALRREFGNLRTIWVPRHPQRAQTIAQMLRPDISFTCRSQGELPTDEVYLGDTLGEMGLYYRLAPVAFVGGSLIPAGGQNPIEPLQLGCAVISGAHVYNFAEVFADLWEAGGAICVSSGEQLAGAVATMLRERGDAGKTIASGVSVLQNYQGALNRTWQDMEDLF